MRPINRLNPPAWPQPANPTALAILEEENRELTAELARCYLAMVRQEREIDELKRRAIR